MLTQHEKWLKGAGKNNAEKYNERLKRYYETPKLCKHCTQPLDYKLRKNKYCNHICSASHTNKTRILTGYTSKGKTKNVNCIKCNLITTIGINASALKAVCADCKNKYIYPATLVNCASCNTLFTSHRGKKTCSVLCMRQRQQLGAINGGKKSAAIQSQNRRSKNEIHFAELCKDSFVNVLTNEPMFNGWDADIILPDYKIAIMWNGAWHYKKITKKHSVEQVQNRDKIKLREIEQVGYIPYIIKDLGIENREFVIEQFNKFKEWQALVTIQA